MQQVGGLNIAEGFEIIQPKGVVHGSQKHRVAHGFSAGQPVSLGGGRALMLYVDQEKNVLQSCLSGDAGKTWEEPRTIGSNPDPAVHIYRPAALRLANGKILFFYIGLLSRPRDVGNEKAQADIWLIRSTDEGDTWGPHQRIWEGYVGMLSGAIQTRSGRVLLPHCYLDVAASSTNTDLKLKKWLLVFRRLWQHLELCRQYRPRFGRRRPFQPETKITRWLRADRGAASGRPDLDGDSHGHE